MSFFIAEAVAQTSAAPTSGDGAGFMNFVLIGGLFLFMYFMIIRPQRKRQKEHQQLCDGVSKGDEVVLNSGMLGKVTDVDEAYISIKANDTVELKFQKTFCPCSIAEGHSQVDLALTLFLD